MRTKRERACRGCGSAFTGRGNRALYCGRDCKSAARNAAQNEWNRVKRELGPILETLADDDPAGFWEAARSHGDVLSVWPGRSDVDQADQKSSWTRDHFQDDGWSRVCVNGVWSDTTIKLENVTNLISKSGCPVWQLDGRALAEKHRVTLGFPADYSKIIPDHGFSTIDRDVRVNQSDRTVKVTDLCKHDLVPDWCAFCTGKSITPFVHEADNWIETTRLEALINTPKESQYHVEHEDLPGNSIARGNSTSGGEGTRTDLDLLADATG